MQPSQGIGGGMGGASLQEMQRLQQQLQAQYQRQQQQQQQGQQSGGGTASTHGNSAVTGLVGNNSFSAGNFGGLNGARGGLQGGQRGSQPSMSQSTLSMMQQQQQQHASNNSNANFAMPTTSTNAAALAAGLRAGGANANSMYGMLAGNTMDASSGSSAQLMAMAGMGGGGGMHTGGRTTTGGMSVSSSSGGAMQNMQALLLQQQQAMQNPQHQLSNQMSLLQQQNQSGQQQQPQMFQQQRSMSTGGGQSGGVNAVQQQMMIQQQLASLQQQMQQQQQQQMSCGNASHNSNIANNNNNMQQQQVQLAGMGLQNSQNNSIQARQQQLLAQQLRQQQHQRRSGANTAGQMMPQQQQQNGLVSSNDSTNRLSVAGIMGSQSQGVGVGVGGDTNNNNNNHSKLSSLQAQSATALGRGPLTEQQLRLHQQQLLRGAPSDAQSTAAAKAAWVSRSLQQHGGDGADLQCGGSSSVHDSFAASQQQQLRADASSGKLRTGGSNSTVQLGDFSQELSNSRRSPGGLPQQQQSSSTSNHGTSSDRQQKSQQQKKFLDGTFVGGWQSNADLPDRRKVIFSILEIIRQMRPDSDEMDAKLPRMAKSLEEHLYRSAETKQQYLDVGTLKRRLQSVANGMDLHHSSSTTSMNSNGVGAGGHQGATSVALPPPAAQIPNAAGNKAQQNNHWQPTASTQSSSAFTGGGGNILNNWTRASSQTYSGSHAGLQQQAPSSSQQQQPDAAYLGLQGNGWDSSSIGSGNGTKIRNPDYPNTPKYQDPQAAQKKRVIVQQQQRLLLLRHASKCKLGPACTTKFCDQMVTLWKHMRSCRDKDCKTPHCLSSRCVLNHYRGCKSQGKMDTCEVCGPVMSNNHPDNPEEAWPMEQQVGRNTSTSIVGSTAPGLTQNMSMFHNMPIPSTQRRDSGSLRTAAPDDKQAETSEQTQLQQLQQYHMKMQAQLESLTELQKQQQQLLDQQTRLQEQSRLISDPTSPQAMQLQQQQVLLDELQKRCQQQQLRLQQEIEVQSSASTLPQLQQLQESIKNTQPNSQISIQPSFDATRQLGTQAAAQLPGPATAAKEKVDAFSPLPEIGENKEEPVPSQAKSGPKATRRGSIRGRRGCKGGKQVILSAQRSTGTSPGSQSEDAAKKRKAGGATPKERAGKKGKALAPVASKSSPVDGNAAVTPADQNSSLVSFMTKDMIERHLESLNKQIPMSCRTVTYKCLPLLQELIADQFGWVFHDAVDPVALGLPDYFDVVKNPMHLELVKKKLENAIYSNIETFARDVKLVFENAILYNGESSEVGQLAQSMLTKFDKLYSDLVQGVESSHQKLERRGEACSLCGCQRRRFEPTILYCQGRCGMQRIERGATYFTERSKANHWCGDCHALLNPDDPIVLDDGSEIKKSDLQEFKNDALPEEAWVNCDQCQSWVHQICALFNGRTNKSNAIYTCPRCCLRKGQNVGFPIADSKFAKGAADLPQSRLSTALEQGLEATLAQAYQARAKELGVKLDEVETVDDLVVRVVSNVEKKHLVGEEMMRRYSGTGFPSDFPVRSKCISLFQKIHGVDVLLFALYVHEYGQDAPSPNRRRVYISYLDSVHYFEPKCYRTTVYQAILVEYLRYVKERGFHTAHIWSCPPASGDDYIFYCHPSDQSIPREDMLRSWYHQMLDKAKAQGIVIRTTTLFDECFTTDEADPAPGPRDHPTCLPYFEGDYVPGEIETIIKLVGKQEGLGIKGNGSGALKDEVMQRLRHNIGKMKDNFIVVHLRNRRFAEAVERGEDVSQWTEDSDEELIRSKRAKISGKKGDTPKEANEPKMEVAKEESTATVEKTVASTGPSSGEAEAEAGPSALEAEEDASISESGNALSESTPQEGAETKPGQPTESPAEKPGAETKPGQPTESPAEKPGADAESKLMVQTSEQSNSQPDDSKLEHGAEKKLDQYTDGASERLTEDDESKPSQPSESSEPKSEEGTAFPTDPSIKKGKSKPKDHTLDPTKFPSESKLEDRVDSTAESSTDNGESKSADQTSDPTSISSEPAPEDSADSHADPTVSESKPPMEEQSNVLPEPKPEIGADKKVDEQLDSAADQSAKGNDDIQMEEASEPNVSGDSKQEDGAEKKSKEPADSAAGPAKGAESSAMEETSERSNLSSLQNGADKKPEEPFDNPKTGEEYVTGDEKIGGTHDRKRMVNEITSAVSRHLSQLSRDPKFVADTTEEDPTVESEMFESRQQFLNYCQTNHCQFDELRRAKHSTMMVLFQMHNPSAPKFLHQCSACYRDITHGTRYHCNNCNNFDLCEDCYEPVTTGVWAQRDDRFAHNRSHTFSPIDMEANQETQKIREQRQHALKDHIQLLGHAGLCPGPPACTMQNCQRMKQLFEHVRSCDVKPKSACKVCTRLLSLCAMHARMCSVRTTPCPIPFCDRIRERNQRLRRQQQLMDDRRRQAQNELYHASNNNHNNVDHP